MKPVLQSRITRNALLTLVLFWGMSRAFSQSAGTYLFSASPGTFTPLPSPTATSLALNADNAVSTAISIGFPFVYEGISYTQVKASSNGVLLFGTIGANGVLNNLAITNPTLRQAVAPLWDDLQCRKGVTYQLSGTAPDRTFTVEWLEMEWNASANNAVISFQVILHETTNVIEFIYGNEASPVSSGSGGASIGIMGVSSSAFLSLQGTGNMPAVSSSTSTNNLSTKPASGQVYTFTPPSPCAGMPAEGQALLINIPGCGSGDFTTIVKGATQATGLHYQWQSSPDSINWTDIPNDTLQHLSGPPVLMNTYFRRSTTCVASGLTASSRPVQLRPLYAGRTIVVSAICGDSTTLTLADHAANATLQWEVSTDSITWIPAGITTQVAKFPTQLTPVFYRCQVTCGTSAEHSVALRISNPCQDFMYAITRDTAVAFNSIRSTGIPFTWSSASADNNYSTKVAMPFPFVYQGSLQSAFVVSTNGWMSFDTLVGNSMSVNDFNTNLARRVIAPFWDDLAVFGNDVSNLQLIRHQTTGSAPNRVLVVEWAEMEVFGSGSPNLNFQVKLHEGSNNIEFVYGSMRPFDGSGTGQFTYSTGIMGNDPATGQKLALRLENTTNFSNVNVNDALGIVPDCYTSYLFSSGGVHMPVPFAIIPANDSLGNPQVLSVNPNPCTDRCGTYFTTRSATGSPAATGPSVSGGVPDDDVWFRFKAPASGHAGISIIGSSSFDPAFQVMSIGFDTIGLGSAGSVNNNAGSVEQMNISGLTPFSDYLLRVFHAGPGSGSASGAFSVCVNEIIPQPVNNDRASAIMLTPSPGCMPVNGTTIGATASPETICFGVADDDVWYKFLPSASVDTITVTGNNSFRAHVEVLNSNLQSLVCQHTTTDGGVVKVTLGGLMKDSVYYIRIYHTAAGSASGLFNVCVTGQNAVVPTVQTGATSYLTMGSVRLSGSIADNGGFPVTASGVVCGTGPLPIKGTPGVIDSATNPIVTSGSFSLKVMGLLPATLYHYRTYAENGVGVAYGPDSTFVTPATASMPVVDLTPATAITISSATAGGIIQSDGGAPLTASGIVYSMFPDPEKGKPGVTDVPTASQPTIGAFSLNLANLSNATTYYYKAYAVNSQGTAYSNQDSFITVKLVNVFPYVESFDTSGINGWNSGSLTGTNDWVIGAPAKAQINGAHSAPNCWVTKLTGNYSGNTNIYVESPQFDCSGFTADPVVRFWHKFITYPGSHGAVMEISINGGPWTKLDDAIGTGANFNSTISIAWYNSISPAGPVIPAKWTNKSSAYPSQVNGWIRSQTLLGGAAGQSNVRFRFRFGCNNVSPDEGWAIDDIEVFQQSSPAVATGSAGTIMTSGADLSATILSNNGVMVTQSGIVLSTNPSPVRGGTSVIDVMTNPTATYGPFVVNVSALLPATTYYYRGYAVNALGTSYGADSSFTTLAFASAPTVVSTGASNIGTLSASLNGNITWNGGAVITASGCVFSTSADPRIGGAGVSQLVTSPLVTSGHFSLNATGLIPNTKYYYRAYAINPVDTTYSSNDSFFTQVIVSTLPYTQDFEQGAASWTSVMIAGASANDWVLGAPAKTYINGAHSGSNAWVTGLAGNYTNLSDACVVSPQFDFSALGSDPVVRFYHKMDVGADIHNDGGVVEISLNNGAWQRLDDVAATGANYNTANSYAWYNSPSSTGFGTFTYKFSLQSNTFYSSKVNGWIESATRLTGAAGQSNVRIRFRFGTSPSINGEGWAIDDVTIAEIITPLIPASGVNVVPADTTAFVSFTPGNGNGRLVVARLDTTAAVAPVNNTLYRADSIFGNGDTTGAGNYIVYMGNGSSVNVAGLLKLTGYMFDVYEYNGKYMHIIFSTPASMNSTTTPVNLIAFSGARHHDDAVLLWSTACESNNKGFEVERSTDGRHFVFAGFVEGKGHALHRTDYYFTDDHVFTGTSGIYYRLKQFDLDGKYKNSHIITVHPDDAAAHYLTAYPVPFEDQLELEFDLQQKGKVDVFLSDPAGRVLLMYAAAGSSGQNKIKLSDVNTLQPGIYFVAIRSAEGTQIVKVTKR